MLNEIITPKTDAQYQAQYGDKWEYMKNQDVFHGLSLEDQARIRQEELLAYEEGKTSLAKIKTYAEMAEVQKRFMNLLGDRDGRAYIESIIIAVSNNEKLAACSPKSIMISAMRAASLKLSVDPIMKQAHLVPFGKDATLIVDYHGLVQLTVNTGYYEVAPNVFEVYEGEEIKTDRLSGKVTISGERSSDKVVGWCGYFKAKNGTERYHYMTNEQIDTHAKKYSRGYDYRDKNGNLTSLWHKETEKMRRKTVLRMLVSLWGNFSPAVQNIITGVDEVIEIEAQDLPDDSNIVIPPKQASRPAGAMMVELGFS